MKHKKLLIQFFKTNNNLKCYKNTRNYRHSYDRSQVIMARNDVELGDSVNLPMKCIVEKLSIRKKNSCWKLQS